MNRDNDIQRPISQTLCGALQKEANCKCLVLSVLIYGCLAAVTWCRCANVTKIVINFSKYPLKSTRHVSPCDDGYIYIPVAFMGMLYLVYLVECYHSPIRIDLLHGESQDSVLSKLSQLRLVAPTIWWKAVSYHYVRRKRQITRYRNGDHYTTTQVYYERVNTHAATSFYFYDYCGVKDISKDLEMDPKIPITKITLSKGFAFSNMRSATEFEEARSRFFAEQELRDDYMEMREGLDLGCSFNSNTNLVAILGKPWFTNTYVYWCLSALLLSWPLRIIIECKTQYADCQVTKLFGVNYDTPTSTNNEQIHASSSQLSAPGSYMLAPSYSEALLMEPSGATNHEYPNTEMLVPSYSEALLYERAASSSIRNPALASSAGVHEISCSVGRSMTNESLFAVVEPQPIADCNCPCHQSCVNAISPSNVQMNSCSICEVTPSTTTAVNIISPSIIARDISEPNLKTNSADLIRDGSSLQFLRMNGRSLENILEHDDEPQSTVMIPIDGGTVDEIDLRRRGAIPKRKNQIAPVHLTEMNDVIVSETKIPLSKTHFCLKSILKPKNKRRYTLVTTEEFRNFVGTRGKDDDDDDDNTESLIFLKDSSSNKRRMIPATMDIRRENPHRTLIFASPIHEVCRSNDPFVANAQITSDELPRELHESNLPVFTRLGRSLSVLAECESSTTTTSMSTSKCNRKRFKHHRTLSIEPESLRFFTPPEMTSDSTSAQQINGTARCFAASTHKLTRSLTERRPKTVRPDKVLLRRSFTDERTDFGPPRRYNLNMETSL